MATYNIFLGSGVRSVGDVTLMRRGGKQVARLTITHHQKEPTYRSAGTQRNFVAPVMRFYGALRSVLKGSYQGLNTDASYNAFQRINIALGSHQRMVLAERRRVLPHALSAVARLYLSRSLYWYNHAQGGGIPSSLPLLEERQHHRTSLPGSLTNGYKPGDVVTVIAVLMDNEGGYYPVVLSVLHQHVIFRYLSPSLVLIWLGLIGLMGADLLIISNGSVPWSLEQSSSAATMAAHGYAARSHFASLPSRLPG